MTDRRADILDATLTDFADHGLVDFTLRGLADRIGTSARMLVHYFGTREQLLTAAFAEHRRRMQERLSHVATTTPANTADSAWSAMTSPDQQAHFTVMFHLLAAGLTPDSPERPAATDAITAWVDYATDLFTTIGRPPTQARTDATVLASGLKGILLDRLITGDTTRCDAAARRLIDAIMSTT